MSQGTLVRVGGAFAIVAGFVLAYVTAHNVALTADLFASTRPLSSSGPPLVFSILQVVSLPAIPLGILVGLFGLLVLLRASSVARWGGGLATVATLFLIIEPFVPYFYVIGSHDASPSYGAIGAMLFVSYAVSVLTSLLLAAGLALLFVAARRGQELGAWRALLPAIAIAAVLSSTAPFALPAVGLGRGTTLSEVSELVVGFLWVALGVALWRHAPENRNVGTTPLIS